MIVNTKAQAFEYIDGLDYSKPQILEAKEVRKNRSLSQNAIAAVWYNQIDKQINYPVGQTKCECKLFFGVPILRAEDESFMDRYDRLIKNRYTQEEKLEMMRILPVTSLMSVKQMTRYMESIQHYYAEQYHIVLDSIEG